MSPISNAEKQARFRKKEDLKKFVNARMREVQGSFGAQGSNGKAALAQLQNAAELPSGWTDRDLESAYARVERIHFDLVSPNRDLSNDVYEARGFMEEFGKTGDLAAERKAIHRAERDTRELAEHLISALELTDLSNADRAAALAEATRYVARSLVNDDPLYRSDANLLCLSTLPPHYARPDWFNASFAKWISFRLGDDELKNDIANKILKFNWEV